HPQDGGAQLGQGLADQWRAGCPPVRPAGELPRDEATDIPGHHMEGCGWILTCGDGHLPVGIGCVVHPPEATCDMAIIGRGNPGRGSTEGAPWTRMSLSSARAWPACRLHAGWRRRDWVSWSWNASRRSVAGCAPTTSTVSCWTAVSRCSTPPTARCVT